MRPARVGAGCDADLRRRPRRGNQPRDERGGAHRLHEPAVETFQRRLAMCAPLQGREEQKAPATPERCALSARLSAGSSPSAQSTIAMFGGSRRASPASARASGSRRCAPSLLPPRNSARTGIRNGSPRRSARSGLRVAQRPACPAAAEGEGQSAILPRNSLRAQARRPFGDEPARNGEPKSRAAARTCCERLGLLELLEDFACAATGIPDPCPRRGSAAPFSAGETLTPRPHLREVHRMPGDIDQRLTRARRIADDTLGRLGGDVSAISSPLPCARGASSSTTPSTRAPARIPPAAGPAAPPRSWKSRECRRRVAPAPARNR